MNKRDKSQEKMGISSPFDIVDRHFGQSTPAHFLRHKPAVPIQQSKIRSGFFKKRMILKNSEMKTNMHRHFLFKKICIDTEVAQNDQQLSII